VRLFTRYHSFRTIDIFNDRERPSEKASENKFLTSGLPTTKEKAWWDIKLHWIMT